LNGGKIGGRRSARRHENTLGIAHRSQRGRSQRRTGYSQRGRIAGSVTGTGGGCRNIDLDVEEPAIDLHLSARRRRPHELAIDGPAAAEVEAGRASGNQLEHRPCAIAHVSAAGLVRNVRQVERGSGRSGLGEQRQDRARAQQRTTTTRRTRAESVLLRQTVHSAPFAPTGDAHRPFRRLKSESGTGNRLTKQADSLTIC
jgi:hypothetical protein